ncbi:hypothetical protein GF322_02295 [Candidatus Dependentiae bacterium]|nr:hypothetical protein [Candidatus Dependentiae bacterium]
MDKLNQKYNQLLQALKTFNTSINAFKQFEQNNPSLQHYDDNAQARSFGSQVKKGFNPNIDYEEEYKIYRDSVIQRFEYSTDLFWKYLKKYLETVHVLTGIKIPSEVVRQAYSLKIISEEEAEKILEMIKNRNMTSHIYVEEIAEQLIHLIPKYYEILDKVAQKLVPQN